MKRLLMGFVCGCIGGYAARVVDSQIIGILISLTLFVICSIVMTYKEQ